MANNRLYIEDTDSAPGDPKRIMVAKTLGDGWVWCVEADQLTNWLALCDMDASYGNTDAKPSRLRFVTEKEQTARDDCSSQLFRHLLVTGHGYVVYRDLVKPECNPDEAALAHKTAVFVAESEAADYCRYRNELTAKNGTDALPEQEA